MTRHAARARLLGCITLLALACLVGATSARADVPGPITTRVMAILNTRRERHDGDVREGGRRPGDRRAERELRVRAREHDQGAAPPLRARPVRRANANYTDQVTRYSGMANSCPKGAAVLGTEDLIASAEKMMKSPTTRRRGRSTSTGRRRPGRSTRTRPASGSRARSSRTRPAATSGSRNVDGNTASADRLGDMYEGVADGSQIERHDPGLVLREHVRTASKPKTTASDFTGIWPTLVAMVETEKPAGMPERAA